MLAFLSLFIFYPPQALAAIVDDFSCSSQGVYTFSATACSNVWPDNICDSFFPETTTGAGYPQAGNSAPRPFKCYSGTEIGGTESQALKKQAIASCPRTCGMCCLTSAFNCTNSPSPRLNCETIQPRQCVSPVWREVIAQDCPTACGFCDYYSPPKVTVDPNVPCLNPDKTDACTTWAALGFCTSELFTYAQKKEYCSNTCKIC
ncbi:hypothetical protein CRE_12942 [Caenorhabditis remanei]|uniref:ShKT domain-containing protein n=1 Tax=Caenorhabditis remanei TaxID=31234 RepID=E3N145_CAERE|nr:hypothetical protein CRE_12942 [Caenorhabditis remanei]